MMVCVFIREFGVQTPSRLYVRSTRDFSCNLFTYIHILSLDTLVTYGYMLILTRPTRQSGLHNPGGVYVNIHIVKLYIYYINALYIHIYIYMRVCKMINNYRTTEDLLIPTSSHTNDDDDDDV